MGRIISLPKLMSNHMPYTFQRAHRYSYLEANDQTRHAQQLGVKGPYPDMNLPYHHRVNQGNPEIVIQLPV